MGLAANEGLDLRVATHSAAYIPYLKIDDRKLGAILRASGTLRTAPHSLRAPPARLCLAADC